MIGIKKKVYILKCFHSTDVLLAPIQRKTLKFFFFPTFANLSIFYCGQLCFHNKHSDDIRLKSTCFGASTVLPQSRHPLRGPSAVTVVVCDLVDGILHVKP